MKKLVVLSVFALAAMFVPSLVQAQGCMESSAPAGGPGIIGYIQPEFRYEFTGTESQGTEDFNSFCFRRARLGLTGSIPYDFSYYALAEFSSFQNGPYMLDFFITYNRFGPFLKASLGQFKKPLGLELVTGCHELYTINRSKVIEELTAPDRDLGLMLFGATDSLDLFGSRRPNVFTYSLSITNGTGRNVFDKDKFKDFTGRVTFSPVSGIQLGASALFGKQINPDNTITTPDERLRYGADLKMNLYNFIFQTEYMYGNDKGSKLIGGGCGSVPELVSGDFESSGYYAMLAYNTPWNLMPVLKFENYDPRLDLEYFDPDGFRRSTITFGVNYYPNEWTRLQVNYLYNAEGSSATDITKYNEYNNDALQVQLQVKL